MIIPKDNGATPHRKWFVAPPALHLGLEKTGVVVIKRPRGIIWLPVLRNVALALIPEGACSNGVLFLSFSMFVSSLSW